MSQATHIVGGELNYRYLGNNVYRISLTVYRDCYNGVPPFDDPASVGIFNALTNTLIREKLFGFTSLDTVPPTVNGPCFIPPVDICYERTVYTDTVILPPSAGGYILSYQRCCRNNTILNLVSPDATGATYEAWIAGTGTYSQNSNPVFNLWPPPFLCAGVPFVFDHSATDLEGDSIVYELITPFQGGSVADPMPQPPNSPPYQTVTFQPPYSQVNMLGGNPPLTIDPLTGQLTCLPQTTGQFVIGVRAREFRGGILVGYTRRDFQLNVVPCPTLVVAALQNPIILCGSNAVTFQNNSFGAATWHWDFGLQGVQGDTSNLFSPVFTYPDTGEFQVTQIAYSGFDPACADTAYGTVTILPEFKTSFSYNIDSCNATVYLRDSSNNESGIILVRNWDFGDGTSSSSANPVHIYPGPGNYTITLSTISSRGCTDTISTTINLPALLSAQVQAVSQILCHGECNGTASVNVQNGTGPYQYTWSDPAIQTSAAADSLCPGTYTVTVTDQQGCSFTGSVTITQPPPLQLTITTTPDYCGGLCAGSATALVTGGVSGYSYNWSDSLSQNGPVANGLCPGNYQLGITDANGCSISGQGVVLYVDSFPFIDAYTQDSLLYQGQSTVITALPGGNGYSYQWLPPGGLASPNSSNTTASPDVTTTYLITATDPNGCTATDSVTIQVTKVICDEPEIFVPNAFTPNNDQQNDMLYVRGNSIETMQLLIFNRWGEKVFESNQPSTGWDGTYRGRPVTPDVYVYYLEAVCYNKSTFRKKGNITLIR